VGSRARCAHAFSTVPVPDELVEAIDAALAHEAEETDVHARAKLLASTRSALEDWLRGRMTTAEAVHALESHGHSKP
jgi:hypothetical protein